MSTKTNKGKQKWLITSNFTFQGVLSNLCERLRNWWAVAQVSDSRADAVLNVVMSLCFLHSFWRAPDYSSNLCPPKIWYVTFWGLFWALSGPISRETAILSLRYPILRYTFSGRLALPHNGAIPPLILSFTHAHLCDTPILQNIAR